MAAYDFEGHITDIPDYPEPGVIFKDITTLLREPEGFKATIDAIADHFKDAGITKVVGAEARGFMIGAPVAYSLGAGFVPARKPGKLPREVRSESYELEYGRRGLRARSRGIIRCYFSMRRLSVSHFAQTTCGKHENPWKSFRKSP